MTKLKIPMYDAVQMHRLTLLFNRYSIGGPDLDVEIMLNLLGEPVLGAGTRDFPAYALGGTMIAFRPTQALLDTMEKSYRTPEQGMLIAQYRTVPYFVCRDKILKATTDINDTDKLIHMVDPCLLWGVTSEAATLHHPEYEGLTWVAKKKGSEDRIPILLCRALLDFVTYRDGPSAVGR